MTDLQNKLFASLLRTACIREPSAEHRFHPVRKWRFDYAWPADHLALEIEGGVWMASHGHKSRHFSGSGAKADMEKYNAAACLGWRIIRRMPEQLLTVETVELVRTALVAASGTRELPPPADQPGARTLPCDRATTERPVEAARPPPLGPSADG